MSDAERSPEPALEALYAWAKERYGFQWRQRSQVLKLIRSYQGRPDAPRPFAGRSALLQQLDQWLAGTDRFKLLSGPAGRGKSALLLHWLGRVTQRNKDVTVFYVPISLRFATATEKQGVELLFTAFCDVFKELKSNLPQQPEAADYLRGIAGAWTHICGRPEQSYLLVIDGMDEAIQPWLSRLDVFPEELPSNLHLLISARHKPGHSDGSAWLDELRIPGGGSRPDRPDSRRWVLELDALDQEAMAEAIMQLGRPLDQLTGRQSFTEQLYRLTDRGTRCCWICGWGRSGSSRRSHRILTRRLSPASGPALVRSTGCG